MKLLPSLLFICLLLVPNLASAKVTYDPTIYPNEKRQMERFYARLTPWYRTADVTVTMPTYYDGGDSCGHYNTDNQTITINNQCWSPDVFAHEMGHHVMETLFTQAQKTRWSTFWSRHLNLMPRDNSRTIMEEGWADIFALRYSGGPLRPVLENEILYYRVRR